MMTDTSERKLSRFATLVLTLTLLISATAVFGATPIEIPKVAEPQNPSGTPTGGLPVPIPKIAAPQNPTGTPVGDLPVPIQKVTEPQSTPEGDNHVLNRAAIYPNCLALSGSTQNTPPSAGYTFSTSDLTATFTDTSSDSDGSVVDWSWHFGDGATSLTQSPAHTYVAAGDYQVTLEVTDNDGAADSMVQSISVSEAGPQPPTAPTDLVAAVNQFGRGKNKVVTSITLNWTDSSNNENAFIIEGCKEARTGKGKNKSVSCDYIEVGNSGANVTNFSVDLSNDHDHFRVKAVNEAGSSDYSNEVKT